MRFPLCFSSPFVLEQIPPGVRAWRQGDTILYGLDSPSSLPNGIDEPELLLDLQLSTEPPTFERAFFYPLLPEYVEAHRQLCRERTALFQAALEPFGVIRLGEWLQDGDRLVIWARYREDPGKSSSERLARAMGNPAWQELSSLTATHTGLRPDQLSPEIAVLDPDC